ncbi:MAG: serine/tyrosine/threonine adenylyltransferase, partial [Actinomycetota bacterium]|nr:serine/tyrosine/threonine adenylyltransferase [Actinomycetota bacterium]
YMEAYDPDTVFSSIDDWGRYAYDNQPVVAGWNLARFAEALLPLLADKVEEGIALAENSFGVFRARYAATWTSGMQAKLGLSADIDAQTVTPLVDELLALLKESRVDYTSFFRRLSQAARGDAESTCGLFINLAGFDDWMSRWRALSPDAALMDRVNPIYIPRNHLVEEALAAATAGDQDPLQRLLDAVAAPNDERPGFERYASPAPEDFGTYRTFCGT